MIFTSSRGSLYPLVVTGIAQVLFPAQANGSLIIRTARPVGSKLIGQPFADPKHFWSRASATSPYPYNAASSSGSNQGPTNPALVEAVSGRIKALKDADPDNKLPIPVDLVTASASGLDPHISPAAAAHDARALSRPAKVREFVAAHRGTPVRFLGEPRGERARAQF